MKTIWAKQRRLVRGPGFTWPAWPMHAHGYVITDKDLIPEDHTKALAYLDDDETDPELIVWGARLLAAARAYRSRQPARQRALMESKLKLNCTFRGEQPGPQTASAGHGEGT